MGNKNSCEGRWCSREAEVICSCSNIRLCYTCLRDHMKNNPLSRHDAVPINQSQVSSPTKPAAITTNHLIYNRLIYRSPEGSTEVHEGQVRGMLGKVAIKVMFCRSDQELRKRQEEAALQGSMKHTNICALYASLLDENYQGGYKFLLIMEFSEAGDLEQEIEFRKLNNDPWSEKDLLKHMSELIDAFAFLQDNNMTHGDIKPRNLFRSEGRLKIGDFGESRQGVQALVTNNYQVTGTVVYFSPLLFKAYLDIINGRNCNAEVRHNPVKSDVYSLGLTFLHMASLEKPSDLNNMERGVDFLQRNVERAIAKLTYSESVKKILAHMLQVHEHRRYDFRQLRNYVNDVMNAATLRIPTIISDSTVSFKTIDAAPVSRKESRRTMINGPILISLTQAPGKAYTYDVFNKRLSTLNSNSLQPSCRIMLYQNRVYITGGLKSPNITYSLSLGTSASKRRPDMKVGRAWHAVCIHQETLFVFGGRSKDKTNALKSVEKFEHDGWVEMPSLNIERENATAISHHDSIYVIGGSNKEHGRWEHLNTIEKFTDGAWVALSIPLPCKMAGVGLVPAYTEDNSILLIGGSRERGTFSKNVYSFDLVTGQYETLLDLPEGDAFWSQSVHEDDSQILIMGTMIGVFSYDKINNCWELPQRY
jgi:serine/threonine protein kinase